MNEQDRRGRRSTQERWFDAEDAPAASAPPAGAENEARAPRSSSSHRVLTLLLLVLLGLLVFSLVYLRDEPEPYDADLRRPIFLQQQPDMSAPARMKAMLAAAAKVTRSDAAVPNPWTAGVEQTATLLDAHGAVLDNFRDLLEEKPEEWEPRSLLWKIENFAADPAWRNVMLLKEIEAAQLARRGQEEAAFLAACDLLVLGCLLERLDAWPEFMDRALELHERGTQTLARLLARTQLGDDKLRRLQNDEFRQWVPSVEKLSAAMDGFYEFERKLLLGPEGGEPPIPMWYLPARSDSRIFFKPHTTLRLFAESFRELKNETGRTAFTRTNQIESRLLAGSISGGANRSGETYFAARIRAYASLADRNALARARHAVVQTLFTLRRFVARELRLPKKLDELVPKYINTLPLDPFSGEPVRYDAARGLVWSVGMNFKDDGGRVTEIPLSDPDEPTAEIGIGIAKVEEREK